MEDKKLDYLLKLYADLRDEVKQRIKQRDSFAAAFIVACGAIIGVSFGNFPYACFLIWLLPIVTIFFSMLILYSYKIHNRLTNFLRLNIESEIAKLLNIEQKDYCWETYCKSLQPNKKIKKQKSNDDNSAGIRETFFQCIIFIVPVIAAVINFLLTFFLKNDCGTKIYSKVTIGCSTGLGWLISEILAGIFFAKFKKYDKQEKNQNLSNSTTSA